MDGVPIEKTEKHEPTSGEQLLAATEMANWLVPYLYGVEVEQGVVADAAQNRLTRIVGAHDTAAQFEYLKTIVGELPSEYRNNAVLYVSGYPDDAMQALGDINMAITQALLHESGKVYQSEDEQQNAPSYTAPKPERIHRGRPERDYRAELEAQGLDRDSIRRRLSAYVLNSSNQLKKGRNNGVARFTDWYDGGLGANDYARKERLSVGGFQALVKRLSSVALDASLDEVAIENDRDVIAEATKEAEADKIQKNKTVQRPSLKVVPEPNERAVSSDQHAENDEDDDGPLSWQRDSLCAQVDPEAFFPEKGGSTRDAKKICANCEVRAQCLEYALKNEERFGIWGGLSERERRKLQKRNAKKKVSYEAL